MVFGFLKWFCEDKNGELEKCDGSDWLDGTSGLADDGPD